jgi:hypothetical protein
LYEADEILRITEDYYIIIFPYIMLLVKHTSFKTKTGIHNSPALNTPHPRDSPGPVFLNVYGAQESIPRNDFHQPMLPGGPVR